MNINGLLLTYNMAATNNTTDLFHRLIVWSFESQKKATNAQETTSLETTVLKNVVFYSTMSSKPKSLTSPMLLGC